MRIDPTLGAKEMLRNTRVEAVSSQRICALEDCEAGWGGGDDDGAAHAADGAVAAGGGGEAVGEEGGEVDGAAVALAGVGWGGFWHGCRRFC